MFKNKEPHFAEDYFFEEADLATGTDAQIGEVLELGQTHGGIRVHGWTEGTVECSSGATVVSKLQVADEADAAEWSDLESQTIAATEVVTGTGTGASTAYHISGDLFTFIPDTDAKFMRVSVSNSTGMTGKFSFAPEYVPR